MALALVYVLALMFQSIIPTGRIDLLTVALGSLFVDDVAFLLSCVAFVVVVPDDSDEGLLSLMMSSPLLFTCPFPFLLHLCLRFVYVFVYIYIVVGWRP